MTRRARLVLGGVVGPAVVIIIGLPLLLLRLPAPRPVLVPSVTAFRQGVFVRTPRGIYHLFPAPSLDSALPGLVLPPRPEFLVRYRQLDHLAAYGLYRYPAGQPVPAIKGLLPHRVLGITAAGPLPPGEYYAVISRDSAYGGSHYVRFTVAGPTGDRSPSARPGR